MQVLSKQNPIRKADKFVTGSRPFCYFFINKNKKVEIKGEIRVEEVKLAVYG